MMRATVGMYFATTAGMWIIRLTLCCFYAFVVATREIQ